eukprot:313750-Chlamydomonas_euryale.AAC.1
MAVYCAMLCICGVLRNVPELPLCPATEGLWTGDVNLCCNLWRCSQPETQGDSINRQSISAASEAKMVIEKCDDATRKTIGTTAVDLGVGQPPGV